MIRQLPRTLIALAAVGAGCAGPSANGRVNDQALADTLGLRIAQAYELAGPNPVDRMMSLYPDSGAVISASAGQIVSSRDSLRAGLEAFWQNVGRNMQNPKWRWDKLYVERLGADAAMLTGTWSIAHLTPMNAPHTLHGAWTALFRRIAGRWMIVAEHLSSAPST